MRSRSVIEMLEICARGSLKVTTFPSGCDIYVRTVLDQQGDFGYASTGVLKKVTRIMRDRWCWYCHHHHLLVLDSWDFEEGKTNLSV